MERMEHPWESKEDSLTRGDGHKEKLAEMISVGKIMEIQNSTSEN